MKILLRITAVFLVLLMAEVCLAAGSTTVAVTAAVLSKSNCRFFSVPGPINFGALNAADSNDVTVSSTVTFRCGGSAPDATYSISQDGGMYADASGNRMEHSPPETSEHLPYTLTLSPLTGTVPRNTNQTLTISGTVKASDYRTAYVGSYSDTVVISIAP